MVSRELSDGMIDFISSDYSCKADGVYLLDRPYDQVASFSDRTFLFRDVAYAYNFDVLHRGLC